MQSLGSRPLVARLGCEHPKPVSVHALFNRKHKTANLTHCSLGVQFLNSVAPKKLRALTARSDGASQCRGSAWAPERAQVTFSKPSVEDHIESKRLQQIGFMNALIIEQLFLPQVERGHHGSSVGVLQLVLAAFNEQRLLLPHSLATGASRKKRSESKSSFLPPACLHEERQTLPAPVWISCQHHALQVVVQEPSGHLSRQPLCATPQKPITFGS